MKNPRLFALTILLLPQLTLADCRDIVDRTVAEMRAGAAEWNEDMERMARAAAGSACVKAASAPATTAPLGERSVPAATTQNAEQAPESAGTGGQQAAASAGENGEEEDWHPLKGFKFNPVTGAPGKKPYERRREVYETEEEREK